MANWYQGTIQTLSGMAQRQQAANLQKETPEYQQALFNLMQAKEGALFQKQLRSMLAEAPPEQLAELMARFGGDIDPFAQQLKQEDKQAQDREFEVNKAIETFEGLQPSDIEHVRKYGGLPTDALPRVKVREKAVYDPYTRSLLSGMGSAAAKARTDLTGVEAIASDVYDMFNKYQNIGSKYKGPLAGRTLGQVGKIAQLDSELASYEDVKELTLSNIAKKLGGEVGVLTDRDIERIKVALPALRDNPEVAKKKIKFVLNYIDRRIKGHQKVGAVPQKGLQLTEEWYDPGFNVEKALIPIGGKDKKAEGEVGPVIPPQEDLTKENEYLKQLGF